MLKVLAEDGYAAAGVDYESDSLSYCRSQSLAVEPMDLDALERRGSRFDAVLRVTVFEHLVDHRQHLRRLARLLRGPRLLVVLVPTAGLFGLIAGMARGRPGPQQIPSVNGTFEPPWHTTILTVRGFERMLDDTPFVLERVTASPSGCGRGLKRLAQMVATVVSVGGNRLFGTRWPLVLNHIFVSRVPAESPGDAR